MLDVLQNVFNRCFHLELLVFLVFDISNRRASFVEVRQAISSMPYVPGYKGDKETRRPIDHVSL